MKIKIQNRFTGALIFETDAESLGAAILAAIKAGANLYMANLSRAYLSGAYLSGANLSRAYLSGAYLSGADLSGADLSGANLYMANLSRADLSGADLSGANLYMANLSRADLSGAKIDNATMEKLLPTRTILPEGDLTVWKKLSSGAICKLLIPAKARRVGGLIGRKCRAEYAKVISGAGVSAHDGKTKYTPGKIVRPDSFDPNPLVECAPGIHFYITKQEAEAN